MTWAQALDGGEFHTGVWCRGGTGGGGDNQRSSGPAPARQPRPPRPCRTRGPGPFQPPPEPRRPGRGRAQPAPPTARSAAPTRPRLRAAAGGSVAPRAQGADGPVSAPAGEAIPPPPGSGAGPGAAGPAERGPPLPGSAVPGLGERVAVQRGSVGGSPVPPAGTAALCFGLGDGRAGVRLSPLLPQARLRWLHCAPITPLSQDGGAPRTGFPRPLSTGAAAAQRWARESTPEPMAEATRRRRPALHAGVRGGAARAGRASGGAGACPLRRRLLGGCWRVRAARGGDTGSDRHSAEGNAGSPALRGGKVSDPAWKLQPARKSSRSLAFRVPASLVTTVAASESVQLSSNFYF